METEWTATNELRYMDRRVAGITHQLQKTLQQKWVEITLEAGAFVKGEEEWRDVPTEKERMNIYEATNSIAHLWCRRKGAEYAEKRRMLCQAWWCRETGDTYWKIIPEQVHGTWTLRDNNENWEPMPIKERE